MLHRDSRASKPEERFVELFQDVFGPAAAAKLESQVYFRDIAGKERYIDFCLESLFDRFALEIDGETFHHPAALTPEDYEDQLLRQNSLIHHGWRVLRWTDRQLQERPEGVKEQLSLFLDQAIRLTIPHEHLPPKRAALIDLFEHQEEALENLKALRKDGCQIALLPHAVASGKTTTAVEDARAMGLRTLFLAHTYELVEQALDRFAQLWPEATVARLGDAGDHDARVVVGTIQFMSSHLGESGAGEFGYIVVDEAHHASSRSYRGVLRYFDPEFLLGLTGTPERADGRNVLEIFQQAAHRMDVETAIKKGILCDVRAFRVNTNVDLRRIRFNGSLYKQSDLEDKVSVPERNRLIVDTYLANVPGRPAVTFCVSVNHAEAMARLFNAAGFPAKAVSGRLGVKERKQILREFERGEIKVLCACDVLNEGWDSPCIQVLLMARPTLSKVIYHQQLGRGLRTSPGKEYLVLFDFVDVFSRHNQALSIHRLAKKPTYRPGGLVFHPDGTTDAPDLPLHLWATDYEPVEIFDWQEVVEGMVTATALSKMLRKTDEWVSDKFRKGEITADEVIDLGGGRLIPYFRPEQVQELRARYSIKEVTDVTLYEDFLDFLGDMNMTFSYKPVWFLALLANADVSGKAPVVEVTQAFWDFYRARQTGGQPVERASSALSSPDSCTLGDVQQVISKGPFYRFSRLDYVSYASDRAFYQVHPAIWSRLQDPVCRQNVEQLCHKGVESYYKRASLHQNPGRSRAAS